jgi:hypothetical protein
MKVLATLHTSGNGWWSTERKAVDIVNINIGYLSEEQDFGELRVYFDTKTWDVKSDGLIYTDSQFEEELQALLQTAGFTAKEAADVSYSEQGMQGDDYVSLDFGELFAKAYARLFNVEFQEAVEYSY